MSRKSPADRAEIRKRLNEDKPTLGMMPLSPGGGINIAKNWKESIGAMKKMPEEIRKVYKAYKTGKSAVKKAPDK